MDYEIIPKNDLVLVGVPLERTVIPEFLDNRDAIMSRLGENAVGVTHTRGHRVDRSRDTIVKEFLEHPDQPDWLLFLDSDMIFPVDIGFRLLSARKPVIGGLYFHRANHFPLVMSEIDNEQDDYGRLKRRWTYDHELVANFLNDAHLPYRDGAVAIDGVDQRIYECDAVGTGCMLIHKSVLTAMKPPWFEYIEGGESEDLTFCWRVRHELGMPIFADLGSVCGHMKMVPMGHSQFRVKYSQRGIGASEYSVNRAAMWLENFLDIPDGHKALDSYNKDKLRELWNNRGDRDIDFYKNPSVGKEYVIDLIKWNGGSLFATFKDALVNQENKNAIVIGSGIGSLAIQLVLQNCNVSAFEANGVLRKFSQKRWEWTKQSGLIRASFGDLKHRGAFRRGSKMPANLLNNTDLAVAVDVFEHMPEKDLRGAFSLLNMVMKKNGRVFFHNNWGQQDIYPMHHDHSDIWENVVESSGFFQLDQHWLVKVKGRQNDNEES